MPETKRQKERMLALVIVGVILMNYPILSLFNQAILYFNIPVLFLYLFFCWTAFIICVAFAMEKPPSPLSRLKTKDRDKAD